MPVVADGAHQVEVDEFLLDAFVAGVVQRLTHFIDDEFGEVLSCSTELLAKGVSSIRTSELFRQSMGQCFRTGFGIGGHQLQDGIMQTLGRLTLMKFEGLPGSIKHTLTPLLGPFLVGR